MNLKKPLNHVKDIKKATGLQDGAIAHPEAIEKIKTLLFKKSSPSTPKEREELLALAEHLAGESQMHVEDKYALSKGAIQRLLRKQFVTQEALLEFVENAMITNCLVANQVFYEKADEMSAIQAAQAAGIFANRVIELKKARSTNYRPEQVSVGTLLQLGEALKFLNAKTISTP